MHKMYVCVLCSILHISLLQRLADLASHAFGGPPRALPGGHTYLLRARLDAQRLEKAILPNCGWDGYDCGLENRCLFLFVLII